MKAFLQKCGNEWFDDFVYSARQPLLDRGFTIIPFNDFELSDLIDCETFDKNDIIIGSVESTRTFWNAVGTKIPKYIGYPECLNEFYGRTIKRTRFGKIKAEDLPIFIKPAYDIKLFTGFVLEKSATLCNIGMYYSDVNPNTLVYTSNPIEIISEYRCFIHKNKLVGIKHYDGEFTNFPDIYTIYCIIEKYCQESPISYTLDIGIVKEGDTFKTILIEINDFWAIGGYGLDGKTYVRMLIDRFQEIKNKEKK